MLINGLTGADLQLSVGLVVVLSGEVDLPHALLEQVDEEQVEAGHHAHHKEEAEEGAGGQLEHLVVQTLDEEVGEGDLHLWTTWWENSKFGGKREFMAGNLKSMAGKLN